MKTLLFDTDVLIDLLRHRQETIDQVKELTSDYFEFACSVITIGEIFSGMRPSEERMTRNFLSAFTHYPVTESIAEIAGTLRNRTKSQTLWLDDCLIAATAFQHRATLATKNTKHYPFRELEVLKIF